MSESEERAQGSRARVGSVLRGKWRLERLIGLGGMAAVYAATHRNGKRVAVKVLHPELSVDPKVRRRFVREGYAANAVGHPGVVEVDDDDVGEDGCAFLVMELVEGSTLAERQQAAGGPLPLEEVVSIAEQLLEPLARAHARGVVHRDIKPENVFITPQGRVKIGDFGLAQLRSLSHASISIETGAVLGTPGYMAPEQARAEWDRVDARTDVWAVGATLFRLLSGEHVHVAQTPNAALGLTMHVPARSLGSVRPDLPAPVIELVDRALAFEPADRFAHAGAMLAQIRAPKPRRKLALTLASALVVALALGGALIALALRPDRVPVEPQSEPPATVTTALEPAPTHDPSPPQSERPAPSAAPSQTPPRFRALPTPAAPAPAPSTIADPDPFQSRL